MTFFFRNFRLFLELLSLDFSASENHKRIEEIQAKSSSIGFYEAFLEAGPQFMLQLSIVIRLGYLSIARQVK